MKLYPSVTYFFIIWLISVLAVAYFSFNTLPRSGNFGNDFWASLANWDGGHYIGIAQYGYSQKFQYAFFPLYPLAIKTLTQVTQNYFLSAILISITAFFLGLNFLYKLVAADFDKKIAEKTILSLLIFPTAIFFITAYSEALFFFLAVLTFYFLRQNKLFPATMAAALASATRLIGLAVVIGMLVEVIATRGFNRKNWFILLAPLGFVVYTIFLFIQTGDPFYFLEAETHWQRSLVIPGVGFWETLKSISDSEFLTAHFNILIDLVFAVIGLGFAIRSFRFLPISFSLYSLVSVGVPLFTPTLSSMPRFLVVIFPIFILVALMKNSYLQFLFQILAILFLAIFTALFIGGYWVS